MTLDEIKTAVSLRLYLIFLFKVSMISVLWSSLSIQECTVLIISRIRESSMELTSASALHPARRTAPKSENWKSRAAAFKLESFKEKRL